MSKESFEGRDEYVREQMNDEGMSVYDAYAEDVFEDGISALNLSGSRRGGKVILPNERLAVFWRKVFRVQFTDGGWYDADRNQQMEHPFAYADAEIEIDTSRSAPKFTAYDTHEEMETPMSHFEPAPMFYDDMVYLVRMFTGDDSYGQDELKDDLRVFENMEFDVADAEECSVCNPDF
jgi:hypothetical protein